jgi:hypothetical protein
MELPFDTREERAPQPAPRLANKMHRIVKRIVSLSVAALFVGACVAACASEEPTYDTKAFENGACVAEFCPDVLVGTKCCVVSPGVNMCGVDKGMGCVAATAPDAGS